MNEVDQNAVKLVGSVIREGKSSYAGSLTVGKDAWTVTASKKAAPALTPGTDVVMTINTASTYLISPFIYGVNLYRDTDSYPTWSMFGRCGGNLWTPYNWRNNASNSGSDWQQFNTPFLGGGDVPGMAIGKRLEKILSVPRGQALITIPIGDHVARDKILSDVRQSPDYMKTRFMTSTASAGVSAEVYQQDLLIWLVKTYGYDRLSFCLDNEPDLWSKTHPLLFPNQPNYESYVERFTKAAKEVRRIAGGCPIYGPALSGYYGLMTNGMVPKDPRNFTEYFLSTMRQKSTEYGQKLLDVFDFHWYPEHHGSNNIPVSQDDNNAETVRARLEAPRSLWDATFKENSWIANDVIKGPINLLPTLKKQIADHYPGTLVYISEYYYGGGNHVSGFLTQADVLGIFGREGVYSANLWHLGSTDDSEIHRAFELYKDFGLIGLRATTSDPVNTSIYAAKNGSKINIIAINKSQKALSASINGTLRSLPPMSAQRFT